MSPHQPMAGAASARPRSPAGARPLLACGDDCSVCVGQVAQEAGDHPYEYQRRMRWALAAVRRAYPPALEFAS